MKWEGNRESDNVEDRRDGGGGGAGGGLGGLVGGAGDWHRNDRHRP
jgi:predicted metalloprotease